MDADEQWITRRVLLTTAASVAASVCITVLIHLLVNGSLAGSALGLTIAVLAPAMIAPVASYRYIALAYRLRLANDRLRVLSEHDSLTSTLNRRTFMSVAAKHLRLAARQGYPTSLLLLDFDHFKQVNDQHGHAMGDEVLVQTVNEIRRIIRETDVIARIGGEEFVILLPHTARAGAEMLAERLLQRIRELEVAHNARAVKITVTMGGATCPTSSCNLDELMSRADSLLYAAKQAGRDRFMVCTIDPRDCHGLSQAS